MQWSTYSMDVNYNTILWLNNSDLTFNIGIPPQFVLDFYLVDTIS